MSNQHNFVIPEKNAWLKSLMKDYRSRELILFLWPLHYGTQPKDEQGVQFPSIQEVALRYSDGNVPRINASCTLGESNSESITADLLLMSILRGEATSLCSKQEIDYHGMVKHGYMLQKKIKARGFQPTLYIYWLTQKCVDTLMNKIQADPPL